MEDKQIVDYSGKIHLRPTTIDDLDFVLSAEQDKENNPFVSQWSLTKHRDSFSSLDMMHLIVEALPDKRSIGYVILAGLKNPDKSIELMRIVITEKGKGFGKKTLNLVKKMAFEEMHAHRLWLDVRHHNVRAMHVYEGEGFIKEGTLRECVKVGEKYESLVIMSILEDEYWTMKRESNKGG